MLNYIWISLIVIGILVAAGNDVRDEMQNTYRNGNIFGAKVEITRTTSGATQVWEGHLIVSAEAYNGFYGVESATGEIRQPIVITVLPGGGSSSVTLAIGEETPSFWKTMAILAGTNDKLGGKVKRLTLSPESVPISVQFELDHIRFVKMKAITKAALDIAGTAVNIALGLIGIMALWLGVMKVAEEAGLLRVLTRALTPVTRRLFPDVPSDHPAVGSIIMNIAANMLGLSNAATPLGLKAMEELNKLNPNVGSATNAMVTFLAINTGGLVLIPATAIAVRATVGSANPALIIGTSIVGAGCATIAGVLASKLLERLPQFRQAKEANNG
jgi:spore maturation protein A